MDVTYEEDTIAYVMERKYTPDFKLPNGIYVEAKGYFDPRARSKMLAVKRSNPHLDIRFVFMTAKTKLNKNSRTTYADWCELHGFQYAEGTIPLKWVKEKKANR